MFGKYTLTYVYGRLMCANMMFARVEESLVTALSRGTLVSGFRRSADRGFEFLRAGGAGILTLVV